MWKYLCLLFFILICNLYAYDKALVWYQLSNEKAINSMSMFRLAELRLDENIYNKNTTAYTHQIADYQKLPPAIIMDIDDTILDTSSYNVWLQQHNLSYSEETWNDFIKTQSCTEVKGAVDFIKIAQTRKIKIFLVSNRKTAQKNDTIDNLREIGITLDYPETSILLVNDKPEWKSDKSTRYSEIAKQYRIIMIIGDSFNDFYPVKEPISYLDYKNIYNKYQYYFGLQWIQLPNPTYGSWENIKDIPKKLTSYEPKIQP